MDLQERLKEQNISMYKLAQITGIPKTTISDVCSGRSSLENCSAKTVYRIAKALDCSMESLLSPFDLSTK